MDACIAPIVQALEAGGVFMRASCCGHGKTDGRIDLQDGRTLVIQRREDEMHGSIRGRAIDDLGGVLPGVTVRILDLATEVCRLLTDDCGMFQSPGLKPGIYDLVFLVQGRIPTWRAEIRVAPGEQVRIADTPLKPSGPAERVDTERLVQQARVIGETLRTFKSENVSLPEGVRLLGIRAEQVESERDEARRFGENAAKQYNDLLAQSTEVTCAYCGQTYPAGTPRRGDGALTDHIRTCPQHPMRALESDLAACRARLAEAAIEARPTPNEKGE
jgi:hypothetical protein